MFFSERPVSIPAKWHTFLSEMSLHDSPCCFNNFDATTGNGQTKVTPRTKSDPRASRLTHESYLVGTFGAERGQPLLFVNPLPFSGMKVFFQRLRFN